VSEAPSVIYVDKQLWWMWTALRYKCPNSNIYLLM